MKKNLIFFTFLILNCWAADKPEERRADSRIEKETDSAFLASDAARKESVKDFLAARGVIVDAGDEALNEQSECKPNAGIRAFMAYVKDEAVAEGSSSTVSTHAAAVLAASGAAGATDVVFNVELKAHSAAVTYPHEAQKPEEHYPKVAESIERFGGGVEKKLVSEENTLKRMALSKKDNTQVEDKNTNVDDSSKAVVVIQHIVAAGMGSTIPYIHDYSPRAAKVAVAAMGTVLIYGFATQSGQDMHLGSTAAVGLASAGISYLIKEKLKRRQASQKNPGSSSNDRLAFHYYIDQTRHFEKN